MRCRPQPRIVPGELFHVEQKAKPHATPKSHFAAPDPGYSITQRQSHEYTEVHERMGTNGAQREEHAPPATESQSASELREESRKLRRLQLMMDVVMSVIAQDQSLTIDEAAQLIGDSRDAALAMFPDKEEAYNLLYRPRLQRLMRERFRIH